MPLFSKKLIEREKTLFRFFTFFFNKMPLVFSLFGLGDKVKVKSGYHVSLIQTYLRALSYLLVEKKRVFFLCTANIVFSIVAIAEPVIFGQVIDAISQKHDIIPTLAFWAGLGGLNIIAVTLVSRTADRVAHALRGDVLAKSYERIISMPFAWHQKHASTHLMHTLVRATESLFTLWLEAMRNHLGTALSLVFLVPAALSMDIRMSCVLFALGFVYLGITRFVMHKTANGQKKAEQYYHKVFDHVTDTIGNVPVLQSYDCTGFETEVLRNHVRKLLAIQNPVLDWWAIASALNRLSATISMMIVLVIGSFLVLKGELAIGKLVAFTGFSGLLVSRLDQISAIVNQIFDSQARLEEFYRIETETREQKEGEDLLELKDVRGDIRFENVSFCFENASQTLVDLSFEVKAGQTVALVGLAGSGKTTLINLLQRFYTPNSGRILIDGVDISRVTCQSLRRSMATVFQNPGLLNRSVAENIKIGKKDSSKEEIQKAAQMALAHDFIVSKDQGYDSQVGEQGSRFSGGERQRIAIARAVLGNAPVLILDEATSALDVETEEKVRKAVQGLRHGRTTFIIAHRLTTIRDADLIIFMHKGRIVEKGSFHELSIKGGRFSNFLRIGGLLKNKKAKRPMLRLVGESRKKTSV